MSFIRSFISAAAMLTAGAGLASAQKYDLYIVEALSTFGIPESYLSEVNSHGVAVGSMTYTEQLPSGSFSTTYKGFFWTPAGGPEVQLDTSSIGGINDSGDWVAGRRIQYHDGPTHFLSILPGDRSAGASGINNERTVIGSSVFRFYSGCRYSREAVVWTESTGTRGLERDLGIIYADVATDINNHNEIIGMRSLSGSCGDFEAFLYRLDTGEHVDLHEMLTGGAMGITEAHAINDLGQVAGEGSHSAGISAWLWTPGEGFVFLPGLKGGETMRVHPSGLNDSAEMVGYALTGAQDWRAFFWTETSGMQDLNDLADVPANFSLDRAISINNDGWIVGDGHWGGPAWGPAVAWVLIPRDDGCYADCDASGSLDFFDFLCFQNQFAARSPETDCDESGSLDFFDFLCFQNAFAAGCG